MSLIAAPPIQDSLVETDETDAARRNPFYLAKGWFIWLQDSIIARVQAAPQVLKVLTLTNQNAAIGATAIPLGTVTAGIYRIAWYARITTVDGVSSSLTVTARWTEGAVALTLSGAAITGDTTTSVQSGIVEVQVDANAAISYSTAYASNTPGQMKYALRLIVERVS
jgi:hypothetical protein